MTFTDGIKAARDSLANEPLSQRELVISFALFVVDPPDTPFQRGYMRAIRQAAKASVGEG
jgi:hypothetical protein